MFQEGYMQHARQDMTEPRTRHTKHGSNLLIENYLIDLSVTLSHFKSRTETLSRTKVF